MREEEVQGGGGCVRRAIVAAIAGALLGVPILAAPVASAALPQGYGAQAIDSPEPQGTNQDRAGDRFGDGFVNAGDVSGDGKDDLLVGISPESTSTLTGKVLVIDGATGDLIRAIPAPDPDPVDASATTGNPDNPAAFGTRVAKIADVGGCGDPLPLVPGADCAVRGATDGVPDHLVSAIGVDVVDAAGDDMGMVYVIDGATGTVLNRIRLIPEERDQHTLNAPNAPRGPAFGQDLLSPAGLPPCAGNAGIGTCEKPDRRTGNPGNPMPQAVRVGDMTGGGVPDLIIAAPAFTETSGSHPACADTCAESGRVYVYAGELLADFPPSIPAEDAVIAIIKNPLPQADDPTASPGSWPESFGQSLSAVGDLGECVNQQPPGTVCLDADKVKVPDGLPDYVIAAPRSDAGPTADVGTAYAIDGETGRIFQTYVHPDQQSGALFGFSNYGGRAMGDVGGNTVAPDVYMPSIGQTLQLEAQGRGYFLSGQIGPNPAVETIFTLDDPTPANAGNFGTSSVGAGDIAGAEVGLNNTSEVLVGAFGEHTQTVGEDVVNDLHLVAPVRDQLLQTISDPSQQRGSGFGRALATMGDMNGDGFLDFAAGAGGYDGNAADQGRIYLLLSVKPSPEGGGGSGGSSGGSATADPSEPDEPVEPAARVRTRAGRKVALEASKARVRRGRAVWLRGVVQVFTRGTGCERSQQVQLQRRRAVTKRYKTFARLKTGRAGRFALSTKPIKTYFYRALLVETGSCLGATSKRERVAVRP